MTKDQVARLRKEKDRKGLSARARYLESKKQVEEEF